MHRTGSGRAVSPRAALALCAAVGIATVGGATAEDIAFGHILAESTAHHLQLLSAAQRIESSTAGRWRLVVYPEGELGATDAQIVEGFASGTADMAYLSLGHLVGLFPPLAIGAGPFVFRDFEHWQRFADSDLFRGLAREMDQELGLKSFGLAYYGARHVTTRAALGGIEGFAGLAIRVPNIPTMILTFRALGAHPVPIPFKETYQALRDGIVDAQENPLPAIEAMRFYEPTPSIATTAHILDSQLIVMARRRWESISPEDRESIAAAFAETAREITGRVRAEELALAERLGQKGARFEPIDRAPLVERFRPLHGSDYFPWGGALYDRVQALAEP